MPHFPVFWRLTVKSKKMQNMHRKTWKLHLGGILKPHMTAVAACIVFVICPGKVWTASCRRRLVQAIPVKSPFAFCVVLVPELRVGYSSVKFLCSVLLRHYGAIC